MFEPPRSIDFSQVRTHTDARAAESALAIGVLAYAVGQDVVFAPGQRLLAHERAHVAQSRNTPIPTMVQRYESPEYQDLGERHLDETVRLHPDGGGQAVGCRPRDRSRIRGAIRTFRIGTCGSCAAPGGG